MKKILVIGGLAALAITAATVQPASADECRDGRYVAPVGVFNRFDGDRDHNRSFAQEFNRDYRGDHQRNDRFERVRDNRRDGRDGHDGRDCR